MSLFEKMSDHDENAKSPKLGDWAPLKTSGLLPDEMVRSLCNKRHQSANSSLFYDVYRVLFDQLKAALEPAFCLRAVFQYLQQVNQVFPIAGGWTLALFEIWLNAQKTIDLDLQLSIRSKIVGRYLQRSSYQMIFSIGGGQTLTGSHVVTAHTCPDLDTCIASFWGWADAFAARLSNQIHSWNLPGGTLAPQDRLIVDKLLGPELLQLLPTIKTEICLRALDLIDARASIALSGEKIIDFQTDLDDQKIAVMVNQKGNYLGDLTRWDQMDLASPLLAIIGDLNWLSECLKIQCDSSKFPESSSDWADLQNLPIGQMPLIAKLSDRSLLMLQQILQSYFGLAEGARTKLSEICAGSIDLIGLKPFALAANALDQLFKAEESNDQKRQSFFDQFKRAIIDAKKCLQRLDVLIDFKKELLKRPPFALHFDDEFITVQRALSGNPALTVLLRETESCAIPIGAVFASRLSKLPLATATFRDFCNRQEIAIPSHIHIVSVLDHHKSDLQTTSVATCSSADVQSCNVLVAELTSSLNNNCRRGSKQSQIKIQEQLTYLLSDQKTAQSPQKMRILRRLLAHSLAKESRWYVHPEREMVEYLSLLYAIFDDTDLLMKATPRDVRCVAKLLNRAKSLQCQHEVEMIDEEGIADDENFSQQLANRILQHEETYSLYSKIFAYRSKSIEKALEEAAKGISQNWFGDTKEQNGCTRVGQSKLFARNVESFHALCPALRARFISIAADFSKRKNLSLHLHMCSTIFDADEVYRGQLGKHYSHSDQLWIWLAETDLAEVLFKKFLSGFCQAKELQRQVPRIELFNDRNGRLRGLLEGEKAPWRSCVGECDLVVSPLAVLHVNATSLNSRKAAIAPYLPSLLPNAASLN